MLNRFSRSEAAEKVAEIVHKAGYDTPTPIQRTIIPLLFQGRDFFIESLGAKGKSLGALIFSLNRVDYSENTTKTVIIATNPLEVTKLYRQFDFLPTELQHGVLVAPLGHEKNPKKELRFLDATPHIIIGTTERIIDHLRRENLALQDAELCVVLDDNPVLDDGFLQDMLFITSKMEKLEQRVVFCSEMREDPPIIDQLHRPQIIHRSEWQDGQIEHISYRISEGNDKADFIKTLFTMKKLMNPVFITKNSAQANTLEKRLAGLQLDDDQKPEFVTYKTIETVENFDYSTFVFYHFPGNHHLYAQTVKSIANRNEHLTFISLLHDKEYKNFHSLKEEYKLDIKEENIPEQQDDMLKDHIEKIIKIIKEEENPDILDYYKGIIKRRVPIFLRAYFTGYLLKQAVGGEPAVESLKRRKSAKSARSSKPASTASGPLTTMFVSVGKNRKVYPKDLVKLFCQAVNIDSADIGQIKVLDSYSFIDIPESCAAESIEKLNGNEFRGRKITVNFARKKEGKR